MEKGVIFYRCRLDLEVVVAAGDVAVYERLPVALRYSGDESGVPLLLVPLAGAFWHAVLQSRCRNGA